MCATLAIVHYRLVNWSIRLLNNAFCICMVFLCCLQLTYNGVLLNEWQCFGIFAGGTKKSTRRAEIKASNHHQTLSGDSRMREKECFVVLLPIFILGGLWLHWDKLHSFLTTVEKKSFIFDTTKITNTKRRHYKRDKINFQVSACLPLINTNYTSVTYETKF